VVTIDFAAIVKKNAGDMTTSSATGKADLYLLWIEKHFKGIFKLDSGIKMS